MIYGWFSLKQREVNGSYIYETPRGQHIEVTQITDAPGMHHTMWDDIRYVGQVTNLVENYRHDAKSQAVPTPEELHQIRDKF